MKLNDIPEYILSDIRERGLTDAQIERMSPRRIFCEYCEWNGFINWGTTLWDAATTLNNPKKETP